MNRAINHIMTHTRIFQRPEPAQYHLSRIVGPGVLVTEGVTSLMRLDYRSYVILEQKISTGIRSDMLSAYHVLKVLIVVSSF